MRARRHGIGAFVRALLVLLGLGAIGVVAQLPLLVPMLDEVLATLPDAPDLPLDVLVALSLVNPLALLLITSTLGLLTAPRVGFRSHLVDWAWTGAAPTGWPRGELVPALAWGAVVGTVLIVVDAVTGGMLPERTLGYTVMGILYGGITEEILMRWGIMSFLAWLGTAIVRSRGAAPPAVAWSSIVVSALLFGALHLPYASTLHVPTPEIVAKVLLLNGLGGLVYGWLHWKKSLEAAMAAHGTTHVAMTLVAVLVLR